jgi:hypothetical protein
VYDEDSSDFDEKQRAEEEACNNTLDALAKNDNSVSVWRLSPDYEGHLRDALGEEKYIGLCQKFPKTRKPTRARLIALEKDTAIPTKIDSILKWAVDRGR